MLGRDLRLPIDLIYGRPDQEPSGSTSVYSGDLEARLEQMQEFARSHLKLVSDRMKEMIRRLMVLCWKEETLSGCIIHN